MVPHSLMTGTKAARAVRAEGMARSGPEPSRRSSGCGRDGGPVRATNGHPPRRADFFPPMTMADTPSTPPARSPESADERNRRACTERCDERLATLRQAAKLLASPRLSDARREAIESDFESLEIEERRQLKVLLSWGGPSDGFVLTFDKTGRELLEGVYFHADWFLYDEKSIGFNDAELVAEMFLHGDPSAYFARAA